jgi:two-component system, cell cycle sensor histidine kinase and response regulator CckA
VKQAGGNISVWSEPGKGSAFSVYLPALARNSAREEAAPAPLRSIPSRAQETILLAEDEEVVRKLVQQLLSAQGYQVLPAGSGREALELSRRHAGLIDLLLTDVVMVGMSGRELAEELLTLRPNTKVLYMSGYTDDAILRHGVYQHSAAFLSKPFSTSALIRKIREVLELQESGRTAAGSAVLDVPELQVPETPG